MLLSTAGFAFIYNSSGTTTSYSNSTGGVQDIGGRWVASINGQQLIFSESPSSTNVTQLSILSSLGQFSNKPLYIDSNGSDAVYYEIGSTLGLYSQRVQHGCYSNCNNSDYPQKTCDDNLIVYTLGDQNRVYQNRSCVFIEGDMRAVDSFLYNLFSLR